MLAEIDAVTHSFHVYIMRNISFGAARLALPKATSSAAKCLLINYAASLHELLADDQVSRADRLPSCSCLPS